jgi:hypothetical protein
MSDPFPLAAQLSPDMQVIDAAGALVGHVKEILPRHVLVDRRFKRDLYVPQDAFVARDGATLSLNVTVDQLDALEWHNPPLLGGLDREPLDAGDGALISRDAPAVGGPTAHDTPLDARPGQVTTSGTDDGAVPPAADLLAEDQQRLRDLSG